MKTQSQVEIEFNALMANARTPLEGEKGVPEDDMKEMLLENNQLALDEYSDHTTALSAMTAERDTAHSERDTAIQERNAALESAQTLEAQLGLSQGNLADATTRNLSLEEALSVAGREVENMQTVLDSKEEMLTVAQQEIEDKDTKLGKQAQELHGAERANAELAKKVEHLELELKEALSKAPQNMEAAQLLRRTRIALNTIQENLGKRGF